MKLPDHKLIPIRVFISSSMEQGQPMELRGTLRALGDRYELFNFFMIEAQSGTGTLTETMKEEIRAADLVVMILHTKLDGPPIREGVRQEWAFVRELRKPIMLFIQSEYAAAHVEREAFVSAIRTQCVSSDFSDNGALVNLIERSLHRDMLSGYRRVLQEEAENSSAAAVTSGVVK